MAGPARVSRALLVLGVLVLLAGCGGTPVFTQAPSGSALVGKSADADSCKLLTKDEVAAALTQTLLPPSGTSGNHGECKYANAGGFGLTVEISYGPSVVADFQAHKADRAPAVKDLTGIGDMAFEVTNQRIIEFVKGTTLVNLYSESGVDVLTEDEFHTLATKAASRVQ